MIYLQTIHNNFVLWFCPVFCRCMYIFLERKKLTAKKNSNASTVQRWIECVIKSHKIDILIKHDKCMRFTRVFGIQFCQMLTLFLLPISFSILVALDISCAYYNVNDIPVRCNTCMPYTLPLHVCTRTVLCSFFFSSLHSFFFL